MATPLTAYRVCTTEQLSCVQADHFTDLIAEWVELSESASTADAVARWGRMEPALSGFGRLGEIPCAVDLAEVEVKDDILAALIRLAQGGQPMAARTVLQCMLPGLHKILKSRPTYRRGCEGAGQRAGIDFAETEHFLVSECWLMIMNYPLQRRPRKIASNLWWDTRKNAVANPTGEPAVCVPLNQDFDDLAADCDVEHEVLGADGIERFATDLAVCLAWARERGALTDGEARLLADVFLEDGLAHTTPRNQDGDHRNPAYLAWAEKQGISYTAVVKQVSRARSRLVTAITDGLLETPTDTAAILCAS